MINCEKNAEERILFIVKLRKEKVYFNLLDIFKRIQIGAFKFHLSILGQLRCQVVDNI